MKKLIYLIVLALILGLVLTGCLLSNVGQVPASEQSGITYLTKGGSGPFPLYAGQDWLVGEVLVWDDGETLCVRYELDPAIFADGWGIYETHLAIGKSLSDIPTNESGNPKVGHFFYGNDELVGDDSWEVCIPFDKLGKEEEGDLEFVCGELFIAAHAVIEKTECGPLTEAPYGGFQVVNSLQGLLYGYTDIKAARSDPDAVLTFEIGHNESFFFSLGFQEDRPVYLPADDAWIIVEFDIPIQNGPGDDLQVIEDTWGLPYPDETAAVLVSQNGTGWAYLGEADNQHPISKYHTITDFDLDSTGLDWVKYVKVQDTSNRADFAGNFQADGYDLNAIVALQDYQECTTYSETAWGAGPRFVEKGNWATYFTYIVEDWEETLAIPADVAGKAGRITSTHSLTAGHTYQFVASGTCFWRNEFHSGGYLADAEYWLRNDSHGTGWTKMYPGSIAIWDGIAAVNIDWGELDATGHIYTIEYTPSVDSPMTFYFYDDQYNDNSGSLTLKIYSCF